MVSDNPIVRGDGPRDVPTMLEVRNSKLDTDSARESPDTVAGLWRPLGDGPSSAFLDGGRGIAIVGVGVDPRLDEPPPVLGGRAGGVSPSVSLRISLSSAYLSARGGGASTGDVMELTDGAGDERPVNALDAGDMGLLTAVSPTVLVARTPLGLLSLVPELPPKVRFNPNRSAELVLLLS